VSIREHSSSTRTQICMSEGAPAVHRSSPATSMHTGAPCGMRQVEREREREGEGEGARGSETNRVRASERARASAFRCAKMRYKKQKGRLRSVENECVCAKPERLVMCGKSRARESERARQHKLAKDQKITQLPH
jgi:hypothetical protein